jgi:hypothetical protein
MKKQLTLMLMAILSGCGGGGDKTTQPAPSLLEQYGGNQQKATLNYTDVPLYTQLALQQPESYMAVMSTMTQRAAGAALSPRTLSRMEPASSYSFACDSGSGLIEGQLNEWTGQGTLYLDFDHCQLDGVELQGRQTLAISRWDQTLDEPLDYVITHNVTQTSDQGVQQQVKGTVTVKSAGQCDQLVVTDMLYKAADPKDDIYIGDLRNSRECDYTKTHYNQTISGDLYLGTKGKVRVFTSSNSSYYSDFFSMVDMEWNDGHYQVPDKGTIYFEGESSHIELWFESMLNDVLGSSDRSVKINFVKLGDIKSAYVSRAYLFDPRIQSLRDSDGDGMWDDWEAIVGLDPQHDDAGEDPDGDLSTNLAEFLGGTMPLDTYSIPAAITTRLWIDSKPKVGAAVTGSLTWLPETDLLYSNGVRGEVVFDVGQVPELAISSPLCQPENAGQQLRCTLDLSSYKREPYSGSYGFQLGDFTITANTAGEYVIPYHLESRAFLPIHSSMVVTVSAD